MEYITDYNIAQNEFTSVTLGNFDGIHLGHRELINLTKKYAASKKLKSVVFSFYPHPMFIFNNRETSALIMSREEKLYSIKNLDVDCYIEYPFTTEFASISPEEFARSIIFEKLKCRMLIVGENYKFGYKQTGNYELLKEIGKEYNAEVVYVPSVIYDHERVSSTRIRKCLIEKDIELANRLLSSPYFILGDVVKGKQLGRTLGFPTINILADNIKLFPPNGVYATRTCYNGKMYSGVTNVGYNPTVNGKRKTVETYLFDFHKFVYGQTLKTYFFEWIRDEHKFENIEFLQQQLNKDELRAKKYFDSDEFLHWKHIKY